jgi:uncharacterized protein YndB with AHSA1/START domain
MTGITPEGFEIDRDFAAPPAAVFAAWTTAEHFARWFGGKDVQVPADRLDYEPAVGRAWSATMLLPDGNTIDWAGEFLEVVPGKRLAFTMTDQPAEPSRLAITVDFSPTASGTHMHMTQAAPGFTAEQREATIAGWQTFFDVLQEIAEVA